MRFDDWALSLAVFLPAAGALAILLVPKKREQTAKALALLFSGLAAVVGVGILLRFDYQASQTLQFAVDNRWITTIGARYHLGVDGIGLPLLALSLLMSFLSVVYSMRILPEPRNAKAFLALVLLLETGMNGTFVALDLILFFIFWELVLVPMYFIIGVWGGPRREYAAIKFFLYTLFGSVFMLLGFLALYFKSIDPATGAHTFDIVTLTHQSFAPGFEKLVFLGIFLGFAIKVPMFPFHTWLPDAHTEAPTVGSVLLAAVLLKMGTYGFVRIALPVLPQAARSYAPAIAVLATIAIVYGALNCLAQKDMKRLIAFSSVGHMGFVMLGIATLTTIGINAAIFGMVAHGLITGMLFFTAGSIHDRYHTRLIEDIGGGMLAKLPHLGGTLTFVAIASLGLPGLAGFWGELYALLAAYRPAPGLSLPLYRTLMVFGAIGTVLTAGYFLWMLQRVNLGKIPERWRASKFEDVTAVEWAAWAPVLVLIVALGVWPAAVLGITNDAVAALARVFGG
ncbi:MAG: NADH-quinone oxidoreductase subunit M [Actinomycetota bacterium]